MSLETLMEVPLDRDISGRVRIRIVEEETTRPKVNWTLDFPNVPAIPSYGSFTWSEFVSAMKKQS